MAKSLDAIPRILDFTVNAFVSQGMILRRECSHRPHNYSIVLLTQNIVKLLFSCPPLTPLNMLNADNAFESGFDLGVGCGVGVGNRNHLEELCSVNRVDVKAGQHYLGSKICSDYKAMRLNLLIAIS